MRVVIAALSVVICGTTSVFAGTLPLTPAEVGLMLRSGYSPDAVQHELAARRCVGAIDTAAEKALTQAGASQQLIDGLKTGVYAVPAAQAAAVQQEIAAKAQRRALQAEESRNFDTLYQAQRAAARSAATAAGPAVNSIAPLVKGDLVTSQAGVLKPYDDAPFEKKKLIGLYFSAHWCPPCRKFTPELVAFYNRVAASHPEFEILFVSNDKSASAMQTYMRETQMPWPAVAFDKLPGKAALTKYAGSGIPCLVVVDASGKVVSDSFVGTNYRGPTAVLAELDQLFAPTGSSQVALHR